MENQFGFSLERQVKDALAAIGVHSFVGVFDHADSDSICTANNRVTLKERAIYARMLDIELNRDLERSMSATRVAESRHVQPRDYESVPECGRPDCSLGCRPIQESDAVEGR